MSTDARKLAQIDEEIKNKSAELKQLMLERERARGNGRPKTFFDIEVAAGEMARQVGREIIGEVVTEQAAAMMANLEVAPCCTCHKSCRQKIGEDGKPVTKQVTLQTLEGPVTMWEPVYECSACRRDFFPSTVGIASERP